MNIEGMHSECLILLEDFLIYCYSTILQETDQ